jgi:3-hydroxymyristoyl/3-hydroxydecanoyl-(acyl carrier protein) dehydratase
MKSETTLQVPADHPAFAGHFPGAPILPGVVLLDAAVHAMLKMLRAGKDGRAGESCQVGSAKFLSPVGPGETLTICLDTAGAGSARFDISSGGRKVATGTLVLPPAP